MFTPGTIISEFTSKKGKQIVLRLPREDDIEQMLEYINTLSREDTFIAYSGEQLTLRDEHDYLEGELEKIKNGDGFLVLAFFEDKLIGASGIARMSGRSKHVGQFNIGLLDGYREEGIGTELMASILELAKKIGLQMVHLTVYSENTRGQNLYKKMGFVEVGRVPKKILFHDQLVDEVIMVKFL